MDFIDQNNKIGLDKLLTTILNQEKEGQIMGSIAQHWREEGIEKGIEIEKARSGAIIEAATRAVEEATRAREEATKAIEAATRAREEATETTIAIIQNLLKSGLSIDFIAESTGLSKSQIEDLKNHGDFRNN